jgi:HSP20 family protein
MLQKYNTANLFNELFPLVNFDDEFVPMNNIIEKDDSYEITLLLAGINKEDISIDVEDHNLIVSGERKVAEDTKYNVKEIVSGKFKKTYRLPKNVDTDNIDAELNNGLLNLRIPKAAKKGVKSISIQ